VLIAWTLVLWAGRLQLAWTAIDDSAGAKVLATVPVVIFVVLAVVAAVALLRRSDVRSCWTPIDRSVERARRAVAVLVVWTIGYWLVRLPMILVDGHGAPFKVVHAVLALVSWTIAGWVALRTLRGGGLHRGPRSSTRRSREPEPVLEGHR
jgi:heme O synthase-like polyprenyltransferase